ncbi:hypothetical protein GW17_00007348 [Ensete ventricosum]|nr:hypothetical protein GW17_00007348 [Ensete ventricosum]
MGRDCHACVASSLCVPRLGHQRGSSHCSWQRLHLPVSPSAVVFHKHYRGTAEQSRGGSEATAMHGSNIISSCIPWGREGRFSIEESSFYGCEERVTGLILISLRHRDVSSLVQVEWRHGEAKRREERRGEKTWSRKRVTTSHLVHLLPLLFLVL